MTSNGKVENVPIDRLSEVNQKFLEVCAAKLEKKRLAEVVSFPCRKITSMTERLAVVLDPRFKTKLFSTSAEQLQATNALLAEATPPTRLLRLHHPLLLMPPSPSLAELKA